MSDFGRGKTGINSGIIDANGYVGVTNETEPQFKLSKTNATARTGIIKLITDYMKFIYNGIEAIWIDINGDVNIRNNLTVNGVTTYAGGTTITDATDSSSKDTGCLILDGGMGIEKNLYVGDSINAGSSLSSVTTGTIGTTLQVNGTTDSTNKDTGSAIIEGGVGIEKNLYVGLSINAGTSISAINSLNSATLNVTGASAVSTILVNSTTDSLSKDSGALVVEGGAGIEKTLNVGTNANIANNLVVSGTTDSTDKDTGSIIGQGGLGVEKNINAGGNIGSLGSINAGTSISSATTGTIGTTLQVNGTTDSTTKDTGSIITEGGIGVEKNIYAGGNINALGSIGAGTSLNVGTNAVIGTTLQVNSATDSSSKDSGALIIEGGVGIEKALYVGGLIRSETQIFSAGTIDANTSVSAVTRVTAGTYMAAETYMQVNNATNPYLILTKGVSRTGYVDLISDVMRIIYESQTALEIDVSGNSTLKKLFVNDTTDSTSKDTGALIVDGGVGIEKALYVGTNANIVNASNPYLRLSKTNATAREATIQLTGDLFNITHNGNDVINISANGNVGIGTNTPENKLDVRGIARIANSDGASMLYIYHGNTSGNTYTEVDALINSGAAYGNLILQSAGGRVGIGTITPTYQLELSTDSAAKPSTNVWTISSDERIKENITLADIDRCYEIVKNLPLKKYKWKYYSEKESPDRHMLGWIAQDVRRYFPKAVSTKRFVTQKEIKENDIVIKEEEAIEDCLDLNSDQINKVLYGAVQKLQTLVETQQKKITELGNRINTLEKTNE